MQFEVKEKQYFLAFVEEERRWYLFSPAGEGVQRIPVYMDARVYKEKVSSEENWKGWS